MRPDGRAATPPTQIAAFARHNSLSAQIGVSRDRLGPERGQQDGVRLVLETGGVQQARARCRCPHLAGRRHQTRAVSATAANLTGQASSFRPSRAGGAAADMAAWDRDAAADAQKGRQSALG